MWCPVQRKINDRTLYNGVPPKGSFGFTWSCSFSATGKSKNHDLLFEGIREETVADFYSCREDFAHHHRHLRYFFYVLWNKRCITKQITGPEISEFFEWIERRIGIEATERTIFQDTTCRGVVVVIPSRTWMDHSLKRSLLTAFLRCGLNYDGSKKNFEEALYSRGYTRDTKHAVERFLSGHTKIVRSELYVRRGWADTFRRRWDDKTSQNLEEWMI